MKERIGKILIGSSAVFSVFMGLGWSFFATTVVSHQTQKEKARWKQLPPIRKNHPRNGFEKEYEDGKAWCARQEMKDYYLTSEDGLRLHGMYFPAKDAKRLILLCHGYKGSPFGDFAYISQFLHENGCDLFYIDQRCCGQSEGKYITFGAKEHKDVVRWCRFLAEHNHRELPIYLYGYSMGGTSVLLAGGEQLPEGVRGLISDCAFHSMKRQLKDMAANWFHLHWIGLLLIREEIFCRLLGGFGMKEADTTRALKKNRLPVLFFHGTDDSFVDPRNSYKNYALCEAKKELIIVPGARHLCSAYVQPERYRKALMDFFYENDSAS